MGKTEDQKRKDDMDRFWDIDALIPVRRAPAVRSDTETTEIQLPEVAKRGEGRREPLPKPDESQPKRHFIPPHTAENTARERTPDEEYFPTHTFLRTVRIFRTRSGYRYYENFVRDALRLWEVKGESCAHETFFSYVPQYEQMSRAQLQWYLWWRENFRKRVFLRVDYSYLLLHAYEIINLDDRIDCNAGLLALCELWKGYRSTFHQLDSCMPEWICDYCLIHRLSPPEDLPRELLHVAISRCTLREFYVSETGDEGYVRTLLDFCSNYDYRKSKFYTKENAALFDKSIFGALQTVRESTASRDALFFIAREDHSRMVRDSFSGALCAWSVKRKLAVEYHSFSCSHELRFLVGDIVKYTENALRAALGIRSRLSIYALPTALREVLHAYFAAELPQKKNPTVEEKRLEEATYEKLYDLPRTPLSVSRAAEIERISWGTTERLVDAFGGEEEETLPPPAPAVPPVQTAATTAAQEEGEGEAEADALLIAMRPYLPFLQALSEGDSAAANAFARANGQMPDAVAERINTLAVEQTGDVLLEENENGYAIIEEYLSLAQSLVEKGKDR